MLVAMEGAVEVAPLKITVGDIEALIEVRLSELARNGFRPPSGETELLALLLMIRLPYRRIG